jgi:hypothetical protein
MQALNAEQWRVVDEQNGRVRIPGIVQSRVVLRTVAARVSAFGEPGLQRCFEGVRSTHP